MRDETAMTLRKDVKKTYNAIAAEFDRSRQRIWQDFSFFEPFIPPTPTVLDVGCGNGRLLRYFEEVPFASYLGVDNSKKLVEKAQKQHKGKTIRFKEEDALSLSTKNRYDAVFSMAVLHHIPSRKLQLEALEQLLNCVGPDGYLFLSVWDVWRLKSLLYFIKAFFKWVFSLGNTSCRDLQIPWGKKDKKMRYVHAFTLGELQNLMKEAGFEIVASETTRKGAFGNHMIVARPFLAPRTVRVMGVDFHKVTLEEATEVVGRLLKSTGQHHVVTPNPEILLEARKDSGYRMILNNASLKIADGMGILWAARYANEKNRIFRIGKGLMGLAVMAFRSSAAKGELPERVTGTDLMMRVTRLSHKLGAKIFLLGAAPGVAEDVAEKWRFDQIVGTYAGSPAPKYEKEIIKRINDSGANLLFVAYGAPKQERWIAKNLKRMPDVRVAIGVGGAFDFVAGVRKRAPKWMQKAGLEWLYRLGQQPTRIKRIMNATVRFPLKMMFGKRID